MERCALCVIQVIWMILIWDFDSNNVLSLLQGSDGCKAYWIRFIALALFFAHLLLKRQPHRPEATEKTSAAGKRERK